MTFCSIATKLHVNQDKQHDTYSIQCCLILVFSFVLIYCSFTLSLSLSRSFAFSLCSSLHPFLCFLSITLLLFCCLCFYLSISFSLFLTLSLYLTIICSRFLSLSLSLSLSLPLYLEHASKSYFFTPTRVNP